MSLLGCRAGDPESESAAHLASDADVRGIPQPDLQGRILFTALMPNAEYQLFSLDVAQGRVTQLTRTEGTKLHAALSRDRTRIGFTWTRGAPSEIYVANADGSNPQPLTRNSGWPQERPAWTSAGDRLAFARYGNAGISIINADGTGLAPLITGSQGGGHPSWAPDGQRLAFHASRAGRFQIFTINADGGGLAQITGDTSSSSESPAWSPDGRRIAFHRVVGTPNLYLMDPDGRNVRRVTDFTGSRWGSAPSWSSDGRHLAFITPDGINVVDTSGANVRLLVIGRGGLIGGGLASPDWR